jgi:phage tail sheath gpL-like
MQVIGDNYTPINNSGVITFAGDTYANVQVMATALNNGRTSIAYLPYTTTLGQISEYYKIAAQYAADIATQSDTPALSYNYDVLPNIAVPVVADRLTRSQQEVLLNNGVTPLMVVNNQVEIVKAITTYVKNAAGNLDTTLLSVNTYRTLDYVAVQIFNALQIFNKTSITARLMKAMASVIYLTLKDIEAEGQIQNVDQYKAAITVVQDSVNPSQLDVNIPCNIVSPLDIVAAELNLIIS